MCTYLAKRGSTYYFRRAIPVELRPAFGGRAEFMLPLRSKEPAEASPGHRARRSQPSRPATDPTGQPMRAFARLTCSWPSRGFANFIPYGI
ncbi:DUF6538 domain-containing protein [Sphingomonas sp.]|uniref:DUF6538 domain-containing protein n=1 Tax=Sphingomonas sp. TaxID=28214 RepID=UPI0035C7CDBD